LLSLLTVVTLIGTTRSIQKILSLAYLSTAGKRTCITFTTQSLPLLLILVDSLFCKQKLGCCYPCVINLLSIELTDVSEPTGVVVSKTMQIGLGIVDVRTVYNIGP